MKGKVKKKRRNHSKKVTRVSRSRQPTSTTSSKKKRGKKSHRPAKQAKPLVTVTKPKKTKPPKKTKRERQLEREVQRLQKQLSESKRSEAAKKGWETRRAKRAEKQEASIQEVIEARIDAATEQERLQHLREPHVRRQIEQRLVEKLPEFFIRTDREYFEQKEPQIMLRLIIAEQEGDFHDVVKDLADEYDYDSHSIYELWAGYSLDA